MNVTTKKNDAFVTTTFSFLQLIFFVLKFITKLLHEFQRWRELKIVSCFSEHFLSPNEWKRNKKKKRDRKKESSEVVRHAKLLFEENFLIFETLVTNKSYFHLMLLFSLQRSNANWPECRWQRGKRTFL